MAAGDGKFIYSSLAETRRKAQHCDAVAPYGNAGAQTQPRAPPSPVRGGIICYGNWAVGRMLCNPPPPYHVRGSPPLCCVFMVSTAHAGTTL